MARSFKRVELLQGIVRHGHLCSGQVTNLRPRSWPPFQQPLSSLLWQWRLEFGESLLSDSPSMPVTRSIAPAASSICIKLDGWHGQPRGRSRAIPNLVGMRATVRTWRPSNMHELSLAFP